ncbi:hypothetical protein H072_778 [Dactylellina haptotyla CBS 200.50]|uniref:Uncharacterized protein n=1 Tax=Dactylellina haptotyla (strain CBS 200.50) TaxID=1284197 RepID=S8AW95_DACHA|nr:hypothetical protein H072_778 [Dactylellina haptotyla CBS 200.50]
MNSSNHPLSVWQASSESSFRDRALRPLNKQSNSRQDPLSKIGPSKVLSSYFDLPSIASQPRSDFRVYSDAQFGAATTLYSKEILAGNQIKLCVGVDASVTEALRLSKEGGELNRRLLREREAYLTRHPQEETKARGVYQKIKTEVIELLQGSDFNCLWPFVFVFSCYEFTSHRRDFQHGHCLFLMLTAPYLAAWGAVEKLQRLLVHTVQREGGEHVLDIVIQEIDHCRQMNDAQPRILESDRGQNLPRNIDYCDRPHMGSSMGPSSSASSCTVGGYVTTQSGVVYAVTVGHGVGEQGATVVAPSTVDTRHCFSHARAKEEIALQELDLNLRTVGPAHPQTLDSRRRWEMLQEQLLSLSSTCVSFVPPLEYGTVYKKFQGALYTQNENLLLKTHLDVALIECNQPRLGFNMIPCVRPDGSTTVVEVNTSRSPIPGEPVIKSGRTTGLTYGNVLAAHAVTGFYDVDQVTDFGTGKTIEVKPQIIHSWCLTSRNGTDYNGVFAAPGDSGAWILADPLMPQEMGCDIILTTQTPVLGALIHGYISKEGVDLIMFQPWEIMAEGIKNMLGEECAPFLPLSDQIALSRAEEGPPTSCGICLRSEGVAHYIDQCPERFIAEDDRSRFSPTLGPDTEIILYAPEKVAWTATMTMLWTANLFSARNRPKILTVSKMVTLS